MGPDPEDARQSFPGALGKAVLSSTPRAKGRLNAHYAAGIGQLPGAAGFITNAPGNVLLLINDVWFPTIKQDTINIARTASDPIPTFTFDLQDDPSHIPQIGRASCRERV